ncbi:L,D-transpeptidase [Cellulosilyticum lentocellum]|uniref:ErfK/YbiS/YcfS/YnhG family protein n=1 Tax=Cellulosilyticum lentocellum (strain ATCC 49066 / DSM 5427 / NCIMB 11756 / RHM5) TaxID=642492 RepID=F2JSX6_CELLD|nr:L,D-transpeptidase [Cellulosilyticum lentocellum]ADZ84097.1 ErfK/YbiS/YcfS/YnhG family protein [Cellulosilyticum lentocellum DSM 5427]
MTIPRSKLIIPYDQKVTAAPASKVQIETYINTQNIASDTEYLVWTDLYRQTTYVLKGSKNEWLLVKRMICSTGKNLTPTPRGFFTLKNKVPSFGQEKGYSCKNAYGFIGSTYLYHSILYDKTGSYIISGKKELGQKASHGCIRLLPEDSLWLYTNMPKGTKVWIN